VTAGAAPEPPVPSVAIAGLGLIGGSLARDLTAAGWRVLGFDRNHATARRAHEAAAIAVGLDPEEPALDRVPLVVLAVPVDAAASALRAMLPWLPADAVVTDTGSTKVGIAAAADQLGLADRFVGAHPMAGDHRSGWEASRPGLFRGARVWICAGNARPAAVELVRRMWSAAGGHPDLIEATDHDRLLAWTSHLPQAVASALAATLRQAAVPPDVVGPGGRDTTRLAASDPDVWTGIAMENAGNLADALDALSARTHRLRDALRNGDRAAVRAFFVEARAWANEGSGPSVGPFSPPSP